MRIHDGFWEFVSKLLSETSPIYSLQFVSNTQRPAVHLSGGRLRYGYTDSDAKGHTLARWSLVVSLLGGWSFAWLKRCTP